jgi:hypothetical protein
MTIATARDLDLATRTSAHPTDEHGRANVLRPRTPFVAADRRTASPSDTPSDATAVPVESIEPRRATRQRLSQHWECTVVEIGESSFGATLRSLRDPADTEKQAEIPIDEVSEDDVELLAPGAVFYWAVGYEISPAGTRTRFSRIKFRRLPSWTRKDLARVDRAAEDLYAAFARGDQDVAPSDDAR